MNTVFLRVLDAEDKAEALRTAIRDPKAAAQHGTRFELDTANLEAVPRSPFAYWASNNLLSLFRRLPQFQSEGRIAASGGKTLDDFRWIRAAWEIKTHQRADWPGLAKGGGFSAHYADVHLLLDWRKDASALKAYLVNYRESRGWSAHWTAELHSSEHYRRPGLTWPIRTQSGLSLRAMPAGCIFANKGPAMFVANDEPSSLLALLAIVNSSTFRSLVEMQMAFGSYEVGVIQRTPVPYLNSVDIASFAKFSHRAWTLKRNLDTRTETAHAFVLPALLQTVGDTMAARADAWAKLIGATVVELTAIQGEINTRCFELYGISEADRRAITLGFDDGADHVMESANSEGHAIGDPDDSADAESGADAAALVAELLSWGVGVAFGRFDIRLATGGRALSTIPEPFDPLPSCSPAVLVGDDGLPLSSAPAGYPVAFPENGLLVDDAGHARDLTNAVRTVFDAVFAADADVRWTEIEALLDPKDRNLRSWLASNLFEHHLQRYSKSRRKAPIIWQIGVPSGRYSIWLYAHRLGRDSFIQIQNDLVIPKLTHEERQLTSLMQGAGDSSSAKERKEIEAQETFVDDLRELLDEVKRVAPLWQPSFDDGVALTMAPLWRLVPQHKAWQKELKSKWDELIAGKYDWAHLAMHLWPERVVPKCATDRSLAIAHGLEDAFWFEDENGKWKPYEQALTPIADLVRDRTSTAVKAALKSLVDAPEPTSSSKRSRKAKAV